MNRVRTISFLELSVYNTGFTIKAYDPKKFQQALLYPALFYFLGYMACKQVAGIKFTVIRQEFDEIKSQSLLPRNRTQTSYPIVPVVDIAINFYYVQSQR